MASHCISVPSPTATSAPRTAWISPSSARPSTRPRGIETQCRTMGRHFLTSAAFAEAANVPLLSLGVHALRGVREPQELFTLPERPI